MISEKLKNFGVDPSDLQHMSYDQYQTVVNSPNHPFTPIVQVGIKIHKLGLTNLFPDFAH